MACGKVIHYSMVEAEDVPEDMASKTKIRWLIGPKDEPPSFYMRMFEVEAGGHIKAHFHPWEHEIFVLRGSGRIRIGESIYKVGEGYVVYIPPNVEHEYWAGEEGLVFLCMIPRNPTASEVKEPVKCK
jgi:quercetin dioxygenase-like cupin family protein